MTAQQSGATARAYRVRKNSTPLAQVQQLTEQVQLTDDERSRIESARQLVFASIALYEWAVRHRSTDDLPPPVSLSSYLQLVRTIAKPPLE